jgi:hypothetical protein
MATSQQPAYRAFTVVKREGADDFWLPIGAAFPHQDGEGFTLSMAASSCVRRKTKVPSRARTDHVRSKGVLGTNLGNSVGRALARCSYPRQSRRPRRLFFLKNSLEWTHPRRAFILHALWLTGGALTPSLIRRASLPAIAGLIAYLVERENCAECSHTRLGA